LSKKLNRTNPIPNPSPDPNTNTKLIPLAGIFYRATACNATHGIVKAFLSVCLSVCPLSNEIKINSAPKLRGAQKSVQILNNNMR